MGASEKIIFSEKLKARTRQFVLNIITLIGNLPKRTESNVISYQLMKSASSVGANYRAACRARSGKEFFAKISIVVEEADETEFWLDVIIASGIYNNNVSQQLHAESLEILKIMATIRKNTKV